MPPTHLSSGLWVNHTIYKACKSSGECKNLKKTTDHPTRAASIEGFIFTFLYLAAYSLLMLYPAVHCVLHPGKLGYYGTEFIWISLILLIPLMNLGMMLSHHSFIKSLPKISRIILFFYLILISVTGILSITLIKITAI